jgi:hypothetical protein
MHSRAVETLKVTSAKEVQAAAEAYTILEREVQDMRREVRDLETSHKAQIDLIMVRLNGFSITGESPPLSFSIPSYPVPCVWSMIDFPTVASPFTPS